MEQLPLPKFDYYYLDLSDPDIVILRRQDGEFVAAFSARGVTREGIVEAAKQDYEKVIEEREEGVVEPNWQRSLKQLIRKHWYEQKRVFRILVVALLVTLLAYLVTISALRRIRAVSYERPR